MASFLGNKIAQELLSSKSRKNTSMVTMPPSPRIRGNFTFFLYGMEGGREGGREGRGEKMVIGGMKMVNYAFFKYVLTGGINGRQHKIL